MTVTDIWHQIKHKAIRQKRWEPSTYFLIDVLNSNLSNRGTVYEIVGRIFHGDGRVTNGKFFLFENFFESWDVIGSESSHSEKSNISHKCRCDIFTLCNLGCKCGGS